MQCQRLVFLGKCTFKDLVKIYFKLLSRKLIIPIEPTNIIINTLFLVDNKRFYSWPKKIPGAFIVKCVKLVFVKIPSTLFQKFSSIWKVLITQMPWRGNTTPSLFSFTPPEKCKINANVCYLSIQFNKYHHNNCYKEHLFCLAIRCVVVQWNSSGIQLQVSMILR